MAPTVPTPTALVLRPLLAKKAHFPKLTPKRGASARTPLPARSGATTRVAVTHANALQLTAMDPVRQRVEARAAMSKEVERRTDERTEHDARTGRERTEERGRYLLERALSRDAGEQCGNSGHDGGGHGQPPPQHETASAVGRPPGPSAREGDARESANARAESVMELVEKMDAFVKSQRPALAVSLGGNLKGHLEVEKVGPKSVALRLRGGGAQAARDVGALRSALAERGLDLASVEIA